MAERPSSGAGDEPQPRVPTSLVPREAVLRASAEGAVVLRVGPYDVTRPLVRAPGAFLAQARGPNGETVLLQMTPLRPARDEADALDRQRLERALAAETAALFTQRDITVMAHGAATREDGARVLFWALPWRNASERLGKPALFVEGAEHLLILALSLAQRLARRHLLGEHEPLLSEHLLAVHSTEAEPVGVPIAVPPNWLAPESPVPRWSPEEQAAGAVGKAGDLWRLGHTLRGLVRAFETVPQGLDRLMARLCAAEPKDRPPRATEVVVELEAIHAALGRGLPLVPVEGTPTISMDTLSVEELAILMQTAVGQTTCEVAPDATALLGSASPEVTIEDVGGERTIQDLPIATLEAAPPAFNDAPMMDQVPPWAFFFTLDELRRFLKLVAADLERRELEFIFGTGVVQLAMPDGGSFYYLGLVPLAHACHGAPQERWAAVVRRDLDGLLEATARDPDQRRFRAEPMVPVAPPSGPTERVPRVDGEAGPTLLLPTLDPPAPPTPPVVVEGSGRGRLYMVGGVVALLLFGLVLFAARELGLPPSPTRVISTSERVELITSPPGALVVAERDGRVLGSAPQQFWVGPDAEAGVLITAPGYMPRRVRLPARGGVNIRLERLGPDVETCGLDLPEADLSQFEAVGAAFQGPGRLAVRGGAVVRARSGADRAGAWLVRCGAGRVELGGAPLGPVALEVAAAGTVAEVRIFGKPVSAAVPTQVRGAFSRVRLGAEERWVPTVQDVRLVPERP